MVLMNYLQGSDRNTDIENDGLMSMWDPMCPQHCRVRRDHL